MGIFRYIVQGFGWEVGSQAAKESLDALRERDAAAPAQAREPSRREQASRERAQRAQAQRAEAERRAAAARREAELEAQLAALKKKAGK